MDIFENKQLCSCCGKPPFIEEENYDVDSNGCWIWRGTPDVNGYGRLTFRHQRWPAHRFSYVYHVGPIDYDQHAHHTCEVKLCVNPEHLEPRGRAEHFEHHKCPEWYEDRNPKPKKRRVSDQQIEEMRRMRAEKGWTYDAIAEHLGISNSYAHRLIRL